MTLKKAIQKDGQRHLYVKSAITSGTILFKKFGNKLKAIENPEIFLRMKLLSTLF